MTVTGCRGIAALLCLVLIAVPLAHAVDCPEGCSCMLQSEAKLNGYDPCGGKLTQCGYDQYHTAKYCYSIPRAAPAAAAGQPAIPYGWFAYRASARVQNSDEKSYTTVISTLRYDISSDKYNGQAATRVKMDMQSSAPQGPVRMYMDEYLNPVSNAVLGGTATVTSGGKTQTVNLADLVKMAQSNTGTGAAQPGQYVTANFEDAMRTMVASVPGCHLSKNTESVTVPAGTFPSASRYTLSCTDESGSTSTMYFWITSSVPVYLKMQVKDSGTEAMVMELTGYKFTGSSSDGGLLGGILTGGGESSGSTSAEGQSPTDQTDLTQFGLNPELILQNLLQGLGLLGNGFNLLSPLDVNWDEVPDAMYGSMTPAMLGALGALLGGSLGVLSLFPPGGFLETGEQGGDGGDGETSSIPGMPTAGVNMGGPGENPYTEYDGGNGPGWCP